MKHTDEAVQNTAAADELADLQAAVAHTNEKVHRLLQLLTEEKGLLTWDQLAYVTGEGPRPAGIESESAETEEPKT